MNEFAITIDFTPDKPRPARVFRSMAGLIETYDRWDRDVLFTVDSEVGGPLLLHDIERGSLKSILRRILKTPDKEALREGDWKKVLGRFLDDSREVLLEKLEDTPEISEVSQLEDIQKKVRNLSDSVPSGLLPTTVDIPLPRILQTVQSIETSTRMLITTDSVMLASESRERMVSTLVKVDPDLEERILEPVKLDHPTRAVLPVKRPDYIGDAQWEFYLGGSIIRAKILEPGWLEEFRSRGVELKPGDAIDADLDITMLKSSTGEIVGYRYAITRIHDVVQVPYMDQGSFLDESNSD